MVIEKQNMARLLLLAVLVLAAGPSRAVIEAGGQFPSGAYWRAQAPETWQPGDGLVIWNHGFDLNPLHPAPDLGALAPLQLSQGYAVAATSYSQTGWALFNTLRDLRDLVAAFESRFGEPGRIYLTGGSLGGLVSVQGAEAGGIDNLAGVYSLCGALGGSRLWDAALDLRLAYDAVCEDVPGASIPGGAEGLPFRLSPDDYADDDITGALGVYFGDRVNACTGVLEEPGNRTAAQQARLDRLMRLLDIPNEAFFLVNMGYATFGLADLVHDPGKLGGAIGSGNRGVDYGDASLDQAIERVKPHSLDRLRMLWSYTPDGNRHGVPMVALHTSQDGLVPVGNLGDYAAKADASRLTTAVVEETVPSHCGFEPAEAVAGWNALRRWVETDAERPEVADLQRKCLALAAEGYPGPCRFAPGFDAGDLTHAVRPRPTPGIVADERMSGAWYQPERNGEGWVIEILGDGRALVYWFTYPPEGGTGKQRWMIGVGTVDGNTVRAELMAPEGRVFGAPGSGVSLHRWGAVSFTFSGPNAGMMRWSGPDGYSAGQRPVRRLAGPPLDDEALTLAMSGSWHDKAWDGEGWHLLRLDEERVLVYWFTFDGAGRPTWLLGVGRLQGNVVVVEDTAMPKGAAFGYDFDPMAVNMVNWGSLRFELDGSGCETGTMSFDSLLPAFGSGSRNLQRLTILEDWCRP